MAPFRKIKAFVIDDEPAVLDDVSEELTESGLFDVIGVFTGLPEAVQAARDLHPPDFVLCDIHMEGLSGLQATTLFADSFVVFMTGYPDASESAFRVYPDGCVYKPISMENLMPLVRKFYKRHSTPPGAIIGGNLMVYSTKHGDLRPIRVDDIQYAEADGGYVSVFTATKHEWLTDISMGDLSAKLVPTTKFMRLSAKHLVAYQAITRISKQVVYVGEKDMKVTDLGKPAFDAYMKAVWGGRPKKPKKK